MSIHNVSNKRYVGSVSATRRAKSKRKLVSQDERRWYYALCEVNRAYKLGKKYDSFTAVQKIDYEEYSLSTLQKLLKHFNRHVSHSIKYRLREATAEEVTPEELRPDEIEEGDGPKK
jgi:hypothetical protein